MRDESGRFTKGNPGFWLGKKRDGLVTASQFKAGQTPWNKGVSGTYKLDCDRTGVTRNSGRTHFKPGSYHPQWNGGKPLCITCDKTIGYGGKRCKDCSKGENASSWQGGKPKCLACNTELASYYAKLCKICFRGDRHPNWQGGITPENKKNRSTPEYKLWRKSVFARDDYTCQICEIRGGELHADHIKPFALFPKLRTKLNNGRTLCVNCHRKTDTYGGRVLSRT